MAATSWPKIRIMFIFLSEHTTQIKHEASRLHAFVTGKAEDGKPKKTIQWIYIESFILLIKELTERILNQFNTTQIAVNLGVLVWQMDTMKQNITIMKNLLKVPINKSSTSLFLIISEYRNTHLWIQIIVQTSFSSLAVFFPFIFAAQNIQNITVDFLMSDDCRIIIKLDSTLIDHYCILTFKILCNWIINHIHTFTDQNIVTLYVTAVKQLKFENLIIYI